jgi:hypothetical protein
LYNRVFAIWKYEKDKFKINVDLISNKYTKDLILDDDKIEYLFKCILGSFARRRKKPIGIFNEQTLELFNQFVDKISTILDNKLKINREINSIYFF